MIRSRVIERLSRSPAVVLIGPRQSGKTTLAQSFEGEYFDLEQEGDRLRLDLAWEDLTSADRLVILDEAQAWPEIFPRLRGTIDARRSVKGRFLLLGSVAPALMTQVSESLAGRLAILELTPLLINEVSDIEGPGQMPLEQHWLYGGYPEGGPGGFPHWHLDYLRLLSTRDLPIWGLPARPPTTERMLRMLAALQGQTWNASQIAGSLGITGPTATTYLDYLIGAFLVRSLSPWQANLKKRLVKRPKVYWRDSGLLHALLGVTDYRHLLTQPWVGASWEGYVIEQTVGSLLARGRNVTPWYVRTSDGYEIDLLLELDAELWAIEIKLTSSPSPADFNRLDKAADMIDAPYRMLVSQTAQPTDGEMRASCTVESLIERLGGE